MTDEVFESPMAKAVYVAGGQSSLAKKVGVTQGAVWKWVRGSRKFLRSMQWQYQTQLMELLSLMNCGLICRLFSRTRAMRCDMSHSITTENQIKQLDIDYRDPRGVIVHVTGWNRDKQQVYFTRQNYPHECMQPVWKFQQYFTKVSEAQNA